MLIAPRVTEPQESDVPPSSIGDDMMGGAEAAHHEHHHPAMTTYNTTVKTTSTSSSRPKSPVYIHRCPFQNCTHGRFIQPAEAEVAAGQPCEEEYSYQDYNTLLEPSQYTSVSSEDIQGYMDREEHPRRSYACHSDPGCGSPSSYSELAAEAPVDQWFSRDDSYISTRASQDKYNPRYSTEGHPRLLSRGLHPSVHLQESCEDPSATGSARIRSSTGPRIPKVSMGYRQRAIDCMLRQLRVSSDSSDPSTIQTIKQTVTQLEDQLYHHAQTKDEYQLLVARKLYAILQQLAERQQRSTSPVRYSGPAP
ncbi:unnamed protein product, partial [Meganyctiphanes norvegica]